MNVKAVFFTLLAVLAVPAAWAIIGHYYDLSSEQQFWSVVSAFGAGIAVGYVVAQYMAQGVRPPGWLTVGAALLALLAPLGSILFLAYYGRPGAAAEGGSAEDGGAIVAVKLVESPPTAYVETPQKLAAGPTPPAVSRVPIQVTEVVKGKAWRFTLTGPTDAATALQTVATASTATTISVLQGNTYRFSAAGSIRGRVHLARRYADGQFWDSVLPAAELHLPGPGEAVRAHAFCPRQNGTVTLWIEDGGPRPQEIVVLNTGESAALVIDQRRYDNSGVRIN